MRLAAAFVGEGDALHDEPPRRCGLRRGNEVARAFDADAGVLRIGRGNARLIELARQIGELMDDDGGLGGADRGGHRLRVKISSTAGTTPARASSLAVAAER